MHLGFNENRNERKSLGLPDISGSITFTSIHEFMQPGRTAKIDLNAVS